MLQRLTYNKRSYYCINMTNKASDFQCLKFIETVDDRDYEFTEFEMMMFLLRNIK